MKKTRKLEEPSCELDRSKNFWVKSSVSSICKSPGSFERSQELCHENVFTEEQIAFAIHQHESGTAVSDIVRKMGISEQAFYCWKKKYAGMGVAEVRKLKLLEEENKQLKQLVADL